MRFSFWRFAVLSYIYSIAVSIQQQHTSLCSSYPLEYFAMSHRRVPSCVFLRVSFGFFGHRNDHFPSKKKSSFAPFGNSDKCLLKRQGSNLEHVLLLYPLDPWVLKHALGLTPCVYELHLVFHYFSQLNSNSKPSLLMNQKWRRRRKNHWLCVCCHKSLIGTLSALFFSGSLERA